MTARAVLVSLVLLAATVRAAPVLEACAAEVQRASNSLSAIFHQWPLRATGDPVDLNLQAVATQLAERAGETTHRHWRTHVVRDSKLNAFSIGDGHIFVTEGMLRFVTSEDELAAVLAHEFGHHIAGHFCLSNQRSGFFSQLFSHDDTAIEQRQVGALSASFDSNKEREADRIGVIILKRGGYNPRAAILLAARMAASGTPAHFQYGQRIAALQNLMSDLPNSAAWNTNDSASFTRMQGALRADLGSS